MRWEARTMRSGTSYFNVTVWKKTFLRFWPIWAANLVVWLMLFPMYALSRLRSGYDLAAMTRGLMGGTGQLLVVGAIAISVVAAMAVCSHLYSSRSANFFGTFPVRREGLFLSCYLAGLAMLLLPNLAVFALMVPVEAMGGALCWTPLLYWLASVCAMEFFFFSCAVFCGMFAGHILALPVFYGVFNALAPAVYLLAHWLMDSFYYGYLIDAASPALTAVKWLTPAWALSEVSCDVSRVATGDDTYVYTFQLEGQTALIVYTVAALALAVCALLLYRVRHLETAGDVVSVRAMRPVFRYGVALCSGFLFGFLTQAILDLGEAGLMAAILIWGVAGCFVAQMLLDKTFKVFRKWKGAAAIVGVFLALFLVVGLDLTGYESRVPDPAQVEYAEVSGLYTYPYDGGAYWRDVRVESGEALAWVTGLHAAAVENRTGDDARDRSRYMEIVYHLKNGSTMARSYILWFSGDDVDTQGSAAWMLQQLLDDRDLARQRYGIDEAQEILALGGRLENACFTDVAHLMGETIDADTGEVLDQAWYSGGETYFYSDDAQALWDAALRDFEDGDLGRSTVALDDADEEDLPVLRFEFQREYETYGTNGDEPGVTRTQWCTVEFAVPDTAADTWAALAALGVERQAENQD